MRRGRAMPTTLRAVTCLTCGFPTVGAVPRGIGGLCRRSWRTGAATPRGAGRRPPLTPPSLAGVQPPDCASSPQDAHRSRPHAHALRAASWCPPSAWPQSLPRRRVRASPPRVHRARTLRGGEETRPLARSLSGRTGPRWVAARGSHTVQEGSRSMMSPSMAATSAPVCARKPRRSTRSSRYFPYSAVEFHIDSTRNS